jgi:murein DD-endopeptidase MepM/ murein hydrolase activator NlpD
MVGCAGLLALGLAQPAWADDDLQTQKSRVDQAVSQAQTEVTASSQAVADANQRVEQAQAEVAAAQTALDVAEAELAHAIIVGQQKAAELAQANADLALAKSTEAAHQAEVDSQRDAIVLYARSLVQDSLPLVSVATLLNTDSTASLANRIQWTDTVLSTNQIDLDNLRTLQAGLVAARIDSQLAQRRADEAKQAADAQVVVTQAAQQAAEEARDAFAAALAAQEAAQAAAEQALVADQAELAALKAEQQRVNDAIAEQARLAEERRRAEEAARLAAAQPPAAPAVSSAGLIWPVGGPITSYYGYRMHPIWGSWLFHDGLDLGVNCGTPVKAAAGGQISDEYYSSGYGYRLFIDHGWVDGQHMVTSYNHLSGYARPAGAWVGQGETVAYVGTTGNSTGCHLHLMLWVNGSMTNVLNYLP